MRIGHVTALGKTGEDRGHDRVRACDPTTLDGKVAQMLKMGEDPHPVENIATHRDEAHAHDDESLKCVVYVVADRQSVHARPLTLAP
jgi:hypothetical protein